MDATSEPIDSDSSNRRRWPIRLSAGFIVVLLLVLLIGVIAAAVLVNHRSGSAAVEKQTTIADLRADPERWNEQDVVLSGTFEDVQTVPYLDQYALYTFRDETGSMRVLSRNGAPSGEDGTRIKLHGVFHSKVKLDAAIEALVKERFGSLAGSLAGSLMPGIPLDVVFIEHTSYSVLD